MRFKIFHCIGITVRVQSKSGRYDYYPNQYSPLLWLLAIIICVVQVIVEGIKSFFELLRETATCINEDYNDYLTAKKEAEADADTN